MPVAVAIVKATAKPKLNTYYEDGRRLAEVKDVSGDFVVLCNCVSESEFVVARKEFAKKWNLVGHAA